MVTITKADQDYILAGHLIDVRLTIVPAGTNKQHIVKGFNIVDGSCSIDRNIMSGTDFSLGNVESAELRFSLINEDNLYDDIVFEGAQVTFELDIDGTLKQLGIFTIDQRPTRADFMHIRALDNMAKFDRKATIIGSKTLKQLVQDACYACGVVQNVGNFPNHGVTVPADTDIFDDCTYRDIISWVAAMSGRNAIIAPDGRLEFRFVEMTDMEISREAVDVFVTAEKQVTITGVEYNEPARTEWNGDERQEIPEQQWLVGDEGYTIDLSDNPILGVLDDIETPLGVIGSGIIGFTYLPIASLTTVGLPHIEPGDAFTVIELDYIYPIQQVDEVESDASYEFNVPAIPLEGNRTGVYVTHHRWVANSQSFIKSAGETEAEKGYATGSELTPSQKAQITRIIERRQPDMENMLTVFEEAQIGLHNEIANALGFYTTEKTDPETGRKKVYIHDEFELEDSQYIEVRTGPGSIAWTTTGWNDGNPDWQTGVTKDGSMVMQIITAVQIGAEHIKANSITTDKLAANAVVASKLNITAIDGSGELYSTGGTLKVTQTGVGTVEISPSNPLKVTDSYGNFIGGIVNVSGKVAVITTAIANNANLVGGYATIGQISGNEGRGILFTDGNYSFAFREGIWGTRDGGLAVYVDDRRRMEMLGNGAFAIYAQDSLIFNPGNPVSSSHFYISPNGQIAFKTGSSVNTMTTRLRIDPDSDVFLQSPDGYSHQVGVDSSGSYFIYNQSKTYFKRIETGSENMSAVGGSTVSQAIVFDPPFSSTPRVTVTPQTILPNDRSVSFSNITASGFTIYAYSTTTGTLPVHWIAVGN